ncbi:unnamed protein product [marine sediment metagenome]|uniref:Uncharacterized protein n=1 Tax=marine sediment metagenome TaxID=412755 RepID=X1HZS8_9ZZZZ
MNKPTLEKQTNQMLDEALEILVKYDYKAPKKERYKNLVDKIEISNAFDKVIEIRQFMLTNREEYKQKKFERYCTHVDLLAKLCEDINNMKFYAISHLKY